MSPLSARQRRAPRAEACTGEPAELPKLAVTPRTVENTGGTTPRPVVRGPQVGNASAVPVLEPEEEKRAEAVFRKHDRTRSGEVDRFEFYAMCSSLSIPLDSGVAREWLSGRSDATGVTLEDFKGLYAQILASQTPAVRQAMGEGPLDLAVLNKTEGQMRAAFNKFAEESKLSVEGLREVLSFLGFPDLHGDSFDRFVGEWCVVEGRGDAPLDFHNFVRCVNLLIDFCDQRRE